MSSCMEVVDSLCGEEFVKGELSVLKSNTYRNSRTNCPFRPLFCVYREVHVIESRLPRATSVLSTKMAILFFFFSMLWCSFVLTYASASTSKNSEFKVGPMDSATALRITKLLRQNFDNDFSWDDPELVKFLYSKRNRIRVRD